MSVDPKISVVLPVYNAEDTLDKAIESIANQTETDFELLLVNDGSEDRSPEIIKRWDGYDDRIESIHIEHKGIVAALNKGVEHAGGRYIARMDADDIASADRLEKQSRYLDEHPDTGLISSLVKHLGDKKEKAGYARYVKWINSLTNHQQISINRFIESPLAHPSVMFRRQLVNEFGGYRQGDFPEDYELWLRWLEKGVRMQKIPEILLEWRDKPGRLSRTHKRYSTDAFYRIKAKYLARWLAENNSRHPDIMVWGAGRTSRNRAEYLCQHGIRITHYVDIDSKKIGNIVDNRPVIDYRNLPPPDENFVVSYVGLRGVNKGIREKLEEQNYRLGEHFIFAA